MSSKISYKYNHTITEEKMIERYFAFFSTFAANPLLKSFVMPKGLTTKTLHTHFPKNDPHGSIRMPVYDSAAFEFDTAEEIAEAFQGKLQAHQYSRSTNPTVEYFEHVLKNITNAHGVIATSSGMAAIANLTFALASSGDNIIAPMYLFGNTYSFFNRTIRDLGIECRFVNPDSPNEIQQNMDQKTRFIFIESISNPQLTVPDFEKIQQIAQLQNIPVIADTTLTPPSIMDARERYLNLEICSSTKYFSGGGTSIGGSIIDYGNFDWKTNPKICPYVEKFGKNALLAKIRKEIFRNTGGCMSPHNAYLQTLAMETLELRVQRISENALKLAKWFENEPKIRSVNYPGLESSKYHATARKYFNNLYSGIVVFDLSSEQECMKFMNRLKLVRRATNLNDNRTLIIHPWSTIYAEFDAESKISQGIRDTMIRLSLGIENVEDLITDFSQALA